MTNSRFSRDTKLSASSKNKIIKRESERSKKMIKNKTFMNSRSSRRDSEDVETKSQRFVVDLVSLIIFAFFVTFVSTSFVIVVSISSVTIIFAFSITLFSVSASLDESIVNSIFEEMNRDVLIRLLTILISFFADSRMCLSQIRSRFSLRLLRWILFSRSSLSLLSRLILRIWTMYSLENKSVDKIWS
jgi:cation transport ATPase